MFREIELNLPSKIKLQPVAVVIVVVVPEYHGSANFKFRSDYPEHTNLRALPASKRVCIFPHRYSRNEIHSPNAELPHHYTKLPNGPFSPKS